MSDLVKRLRGASSSPARDTMGIGEHWNLEDEAADEIERNRAAIAELRSALKLALKALPFSTHPDAFEAVQIAEKLLNTTEKRK